MCNDMATGNINFLEKILITTKHQLHFLSFYYNMSTQACYNF